MAYEIRELSGSLFKNEKKTEEKHPQMQGSCLIEGIEYWVSAWTKEGAKGRWQSLAFKRKDAKPDTKPAPASIEQMDDDVPF
jgi:hypothetical protein